MNYCKLRSIVFWLLIFYTTTMLIFTFSKQSKNSIYYETPIELSKTVINCKLDKNYNLIKPLTSNFLPQPINVLTAHASSATYFHDKLFAVWFAGTREGATDVQIYKSNLINNRWTNAESITNATDSTKEANWFLRKLGNPSIIKFNNQLYVFYVGVTAGGWAGSRIYFKKSKDGVIWSPARIIVSNAFFNLSSLVRNAPIIINQRYLLIPAYHELARKVPEYLLFDTVTEKIIDRYRVPARGFLQPTAVVKENGDIENYFRDGGDYGKTGFQKWRVVKNNIQMFSADAPVMLPIKNTNSGIFAINLDGNCTWLNFNVNGREQLILQNLCSGSGSEAKIIIEDSKIKRDEYSYPFIVNNGNEIDVFYTWGRQKIAHRKYLYSDLAKICEF